MLFVVKATDSAGNATWLTTANIDGIRTLGPRDTAEVFHTRIDASVAVSKVPQPLKTDGTMFSIEFAD